MKMRILSRSDIMKAVDLDKIMETVENVYKLRAQEKTVVWPTVFYDFVQGHKDMDIKSGYLKGEEIHGLKIINWTEANAEKGLPTLVGLIMVFDTDTGMPLGVLDGSYITGLRTGCAGAIGARYLARKDPETLFVLGAGNQAFFQAGAFIKQFESLKKIYVADPVAPDNARKFTQQIRQRLDEQLRVDAGDIVFEAACGEEEMRRAVADSHMIVTVTPARVPVIKKEWIKPGTHLSCIGSDMSGKEEIEPEIFEKAVIYCDDKEHCMEVGEMEIPLKKGLITEEDISGEIGNLILGRSAGRTGDDQITIYDATGMALLDIAAAKAAIETAEKMGLGQVVEI